MSAAAAPPMFDCRKAFAETLLALAESDPRIVAVCNDSVGSSNLVAFAAAHPRRLINVGIAEQNMVGVAAGLANGGFIPFVCAASPFLTGRALEQIKADIAYSGHHVVLCGMSPGLAYGELGPTHHSIEDLAWLRAIPKLTVVVPADPRETEAAVRWAANAGRPVFLRIGRFPVPAVTTATAATFAVGHWTELRSGGDATIIAAGAMVSRAIDAATALAAEGIAARVLNASTIKPVDRAAILCAAAETCRIVTAEEAVVEGGLGAAVAEIVIQHRPVPMRILGVTSFAPTGSTAFLLEHFGLTATRIAAAVHELMAWRP